MEWRCAVKPSASDSASAAGARAASASASHERTDVRLRKSNTDSPDEKRAVREVGSTDRTCDVIADGFRRMPPEKYRARVPHLCEQRARVCRRDLKMLGRNPVREGCRIRKPRNQDDRSVVFPGLRRNLAPRQDIQLPLHFPRHRIGETGVIGDQDRL